MQLSLSSKPYYLGPVVRPVISGNSHISVAQELKHTERIMPAFILVMVSGSEDVMFQPVLWEFRASARG